MSLELGQSSSGIGCTINERKQWRSRKRQGKKKITVLHLIRDVCSSNESCLEWMKEMGFIPKVMFCLNCSKKMKFESQENSIDGYVWRCSEKECENSAITFSARHGSWFDNTNISLIELLLLTYLWIHGLTEKQIMKELNMEEETYNEWNLKLTKICEESYLRTSTEEEGESEKINNRTYNLGGNAKRNRYVMMWLHKNKSRDVFIEFWKDADSSR